MAETPTSAASGTQSTTVTTEHVLFQSSAAGVYQFVVDLAASAAGDVFELRVKRIALGSGTLRVDLYAMYCGVQPTDDVFKESIPVGTDLSDTGAVTFTLKQTFGSTRSIPWKALQY